MHSWENIIISLSYLIEARLTAAVVLTADYMNVIIFKLLKIKVEITAVAK